MQEEEEERLQRLRLSSLRDSGDPVQEFWKRERFGSFSDRKWKQVV